MKGMLRISPALAIDDAELEERFVRASGPGGQNVNKLSTAVELRFDVARSSLPAAVKARLATLAGRRLTDDGVLLIDSREHRTQRQNREEARARLADLIRQALVVPKRRRPTKATKGSQERRLAGKKRRSDVKAKRGRAGGDD
jgi:ribosome-associated protein